MTNANVSRRSIAKGAAWGVPALTVAAAAPAMAASPVPSVLGSSYAYYVADTVKSTITGEVRPTDVGAGCSYTVSNGPANVTNLSATYWLPSPNFKFATVTSNGWTPLARDTSHAAKVGPSTGLTYYAYTTTYAGTGDPTTTCGPTYSFKAPAVAAPAKDPAGSYFYQLTYKLNGTTTTNPLRLINNP